MIIKRNMNDAIDIYAEVQEAEDPVIVLIRNPKVYLERQNPLVVYNNKQLFTKYRMGKEVANIIIDLVRDELTVHNNRGCPISPEIQVLATIRYLAKGAYGDDTGEQHGFSQPTLSRIVRRVVRAIARHRDDFIDFPREDEIPTIKADFYNIAQCPSIVGAIDCTHVKIKNPGGENPLMYINRKGYYSLNVQVVCDAKGRVRDVVARWRGSTHDSRIWNECTLKRKFENGEIDGILVGDNGYACSRYLLTPLLNPRNEAEERYNRAHISTRNIIERVFGVMKNKFRCFFNGMNINLNTTKAAIVAVVIIHNILTNDRLQHRGQEPEEEEQEVGNEENNVYNNGEVAVENVFRQNYIRRYFNN